MAVESAVKVPLQVCHALSQPSELALHRGAALVASVRAVLHLIQPGPGGRQGRGRPLHRGRQALHRGVQALLHLEVLLVRLPPGLHLLGGAPLRREELLHLLGVLVRRGPEQALEALEALLRVGQVLAEGQLPGHDLLHPVVLPLHVGLQLGAPVLQPVCVLGALHRFLSEEVLDHREALPHLLLQRSLVLLRQLRDARHEVREPAVQVGGELLDPRRLQVAALLVGRRFAPRSAARRPRFALAGGRRAGRQGQVCAHVHFLVLAAVPGRAGAGCCCRHRIPGPRHKRSLGPVGLFGRGLSPRAADFPVRRAGRVARRAAGRVAGRAALCRVGKFLFVALCLLK
mmetsp:Transcript_70629/g.195185  ORF Transcript_70629/g.195185 Transcript_70629/m.195185 type:complete len:344 (-) Transcript_70629:63-1094(-)